MDALETAIDCSAHPSGSALLTMSQAPEPESQRSVITLVVLDEGTVLGTVDTPSSSNLPEASHIKNISEQCSGSLQTKETDPSTSSHKKPSKSAKRLHLSHPSKSVAHRSIPKPK